METKERWAGLEDEAWLHIYGQYQWHSPATIRGSRAGLEALKLAIDAALAYSPAPANVMATDGEGYQVEVHMVNVVSLLGEPEYMMLAEHAANAQEYARAERNRLHVLGYSYVPSPQQQEMK